MKQRGGRLRSALRNGHTITHLSCLRRRGDEIWPPWLARAPGSVDVSTLSGDSFHAEYCLHICADRARTSAVRRHGLPGHCPRPLHRSRLASGLAVPVTQIKFGVPLAPYPEALDIHLLRGQSTGNLHDHLYVQDAADSKWKSVVAEYTGNDIEISFVPVLVDRRPKRLLAKSTLSP
jgi:hypothetical protein